MNTNSMKITIDSLLLESHKIEFNKKIKILNSLIEKLSYLNNTLQYKLELDKISYLILDLYRYSNCINLNNEFISIMLQYLKDIKTSDCDYFILNNKNSDIITLTLNCIKIIQSKL